MVMERFPRHRHRSAGPEKNRLIRAVEERARFTTYLVPAPNKRTVSDTEKKVREQHRASEQERKRERGKDRLTLISPPAILSFLSPSFFFIFLRRLPFPSFSFVNDLKSRPAIKDSPPFFDYYNATRQYVVYKLNAITSHFLFSPHSPVFCSGEGKAIFVDYARGKARASLKDVVEGLDLLDASAQHVYPIILLDLWDEINRLTQIHIRLRLQFERLDSFKSRIIKACLIKSVSVFFSFFLEQRERITFLPILQTPVHVMLKSHLFQTYFIS